MRITIQHHYYYSYFYIFTDLIISLTIGQFIAPPADVGDFLPVMLNVNLGIFYENVIAQILATNGHKLYYHTMYNEVQKRNYEVDFLISDGKKISPIEVKSSSYKAHKSLDIFCEKYSNRIKNRYVIYPKDLEVKDNVIYLPTYLAMFL